MGDSQYSFSLTTFSPSGKLGQIEHALTAVGSGQTSLGIKAANGVVIATEKKLPSILVDETSVQKIQTLTPNIGVVYSGMGPDSRVLVRKSRKQAEQYFRLYKESIPVTQLVRETATVMQEFTQSGSLRRCGVRPFGVSLLVAGFDDKGPQLYQVDPSGSYFSWKASAMGKNVSNAKTFLEKRDGELDGDVAHRIKAGWLNWKSATGVLCDPDMPHRLKGKFYRTAIRPALLYGTECWAVKQCHVQKMNVAEMRMLRWMCGHTKKDRLRNEVIREKVRVASIEDKMMENRLRWFGHVRRRPVDAPVRRLESWGTSNIVKGRGRPKKTWIKYTEDMELDDAVHTAILTLKEGFEGQISSKNIEIGVIGNDKVFKILTPSEIEDYLQEVE
ncbi:hypothetical protein OROMI_023497 [Orobanche minor]